MLSIIHKIVYVICEYTITYNHEYIFTFVLLILWELKKPAADCADLLKRGHSTSCVNNITVAGKTVQVFCDQSTNNGSWLVNVSAHLTLPIVRHFLALQRNNHKYVNTFTHTHTRIHTRTRLCNNASEDYFSYMFEEWIVPDCNAVIRNLVYKVVKAFSMKNTTLR